MKMRKIAVLILCMAILLTLGAVTVQGGDAVKDVSTVAELRAALEDNEGGHIRLVKDITFTQANAARGDIGVSLGEGDYIIDLNGHRIKYEFMGGVGNKVGVPLEMRHTSSLTINGPGNIFGGSAAIEHLNQFGILTVNGGTLEASTGSGIRKTGGITYINGGTVRGSFNSISHEDGIVVLNGGTVKSVVSKNMGGNKAGKRGLIKDGVFTGDTIIEDIILMVEDLTISPGSKMRVIRGGGLIVEKNFVNNGSFTYESGLKSIGGDAVISKEYQVAISQDVTLKNLKMQERCFLVIENGATVTVTAVFSTEVNCGINAENGFLKLLGTIDHKGNSTGVPVLEEIEHSGGHGEPGKEDRDFNEATLAAEALRELGLFRGVGTYPDGAVNYELERRPRRDEALVMLIRLLAKEEEAEAGNWTHPFTDVTWADKYVGYAYENKLTNGISATEFGMGDASCQMYLTFVLRALGYSDAGGTDFTWDKPESLAREVGILPDTVDLENFLRADMVLISEAALWARLKDSPVTLFEKLFG